MSEKLLKYAYVNSADNTKFFPAGVPKPLLGIEKPRIEQRGSRTLLYWTVGGDTSNVASYKVSNILCLDFCDSL
ncbi:unnamed protein product [Gongylonema pulchrum]|uniref:Phage protein n=1 Tax=Gongylonema pulchrum TaxID=637853 RepID=A0A183EW63_9BILA|nr:unnamed protein product [Gongylonema pulchrum]